MKRGDIAHCNNAGYALQGKFQKYETKVCKKKQKNGTENSDTERVELNLVQRQMYRRLMYGLKDYTPNQISGMSNETITRIVKDHEKAERYLHILKAKKCYAKETNLIKSIFPHAKIGEKDYDWLVNLPKDATLKKLKISTKDVIEEFIKRKLLPKDFFSINPNNINLP